MQRSCCDTPSAPAAPIFSYWCGHLGTLEPGSCSEGQLEPPEPCVRAPPPLVPAGPRDHAKRGSQRGGESRRAGSDPSGPEGPLEATTELTQFPTQGKGARWGVSGTGWRLVFEPRGSQRPRVLSFEHLSILGLSLPGLKVVARLGSPRLAQGARLALPPHPPALAANGSSSPALHCPGRRGLGRIKQPGGENAEIAKGQGLQRCQEAERHTLGQACAAPQSGSKPRKCRFRDEIHISFFQQGRLPQGTEASSGPLP